jgi:hypothetical protein
VHLRLSELITINLFCFILSRLLVYLGRTTERIESNFFLNSFPLFGRSIDAVGCPDLRVAPISLHVDHGCFWRWKHFGLGKNYVFFVFCLCACLLSKCRCHLIKSICFRQTLSHAFRFLWRNFVCNYLYRTSIALSINLPLCYSVSLSFENIDRVTIVMRVKCQVKRIVCDPFLMNRQFQSCPSSSVFVVFYILTIFGTYIIRLLIPGFESNSHCKDFFL